MSAADPNGAPPYQIIRFSSIRLGGPPRRLSRGGRLDEIVDAEIVFACVLEDGEALAAQVLLRGRNPQIGNGFRGLTMEYGFWYFI